VFEAERQRQYSRELMFSTVVELMTLVSLGLRPSLHAAARQMDNLPVSLTSLYDKVNHTEPGILQALVQGSAQRLAPVMAHMDVQPGLAGYELRVLDGNHLPGSEKRLGVLRGHRGAALPGQSIVVYDPDSGLVTDMIAGEDAHQSERTLAIPLLQGAKPGQVWIADRHFCTRTLLTGWDTAGAGFIVREHTKHPRQPGDLARLWPHRHRPGPRTRDCACRLCRVLAVRRTHARCTHRRRRHDDPAVDQSAGPYQCRTGGRVVPPTLAH
jgi:IS4 transposase